MRKLAILVGTLSMAAMHAFPASAQTWSSPRTRPALWQIIAIDESGEPGWPYGDEDIAGDSLASFDADEAASDLRTVYADADATRLWLRAYVASASAPPAQVLVYFFIDGDDRDSTGGPADDDGLWPELIADPTSGGYEHAFAARGDGMLEGAWRWNAQAASWTPLVQPPPDTIVQVDRDLDPIRIGPMEHGYVQIELAHTLTQLDASCTSNLFVRTWHDDAPSRAFGDDDDRAFGCRPTLDVFGDPDVLREPGCDQDSDCPAGGRCRDGLCLFTYECVADRDCRTDHRCEGGACLRVVERSCSADTECLGLVCRNGDCVACTENGAGACEDPLLCSPNGQCVDRDRGAPNAGSGGTAGSGGRGGNGGRAGSGSGAGGSGGTPPGTVRGGAFQCAVTAGGRDATDGVGWLVIALAVSWRWRAIRLRARRASSARTRRSS